MSSAEMISPHLEWFERQEGLSLEYRFHATSTEELNRAFVLIPLIGEPGGAGRHLNEVLQHQKSHKVDQPERAVFSIVRSMGEYYRDAQTKKSLTHELIDNLKHVNPELAPTLVADEIKDTDSLQSLHEYIDVKKAAYEQDRRLPISKAVQVEEVDTEIVIPAASVDYMQLFETQGYVVKDLKELATATNYMHTNREVFWRNMLMSSRSHWLVTKEIDSILSQY